MLRPSVRRAVRRAGRCWRCGRRKGSILRAEALVPRLPESSVPVFIGMCFGQGSGGGGGGIKSASVDPILDAFLSFPQFVSISPGCRPTDLCAQEVTGSPSWRGPKEMQPWACGTEELSGIKREDEGRQRPGQARGRGVWGAAGAARGRRAAGRGSAGRPPGAPPAAGGAGAGEAAAAAGEAGRGLPHRGPTQRGWAVSRLPA